MNCACFFDFRQQFAVGMPLVRLLAPPIDQHSPEHPAERALSVPGQAPGDWSWVDGTPPDPMPVKRLECSGRACKTEAPCDIRMAPRQWTLNEESLSNSLGECQYGTIHAKWPEGKQNNFFLHGIGGCYPSAPAIKSCSTISVKPFSVA